jgi:hypothetical protein
MGCEIVDNLVQKYSGTGAAGGVDAIYVGADRGSNLHELLQVRAIAGEGLEGVPRNAAVYACRYLERHIGAGTFDALKRRGGLRADILESGVIRAGDEIVLL